MADADAHTLHPPAWQHLDSEGWWPLDTAVRASAELWDWLPTWADLGAAASQPHWPIASSWALLLALVPALALCVDRLLGEPGLRWHPVVWMGRYLNALGRHLAPPVAGAAHARNVDRRTGHVTQPAQATQTTQDAAATSAQTKPAYVELAQRHAPAQVPERPARDFMHGMLAWLGGALLVVGLAAWVQAMALRLPIWAAVPVLALLLKPMLAWVMLHDEVVAVEGALAQSLQAGRDQLSRLVSRDTSALDASGVREAAIETLAENLCDSVVAPLFWFALLGLPGAALYRFANTADAMWGYPGVRAGKNWAWAGKWAARADDVMNWVPARITAALLLVGAPAAAWLHLPHEARQTPSPNGGWTMGAMALHLGVRLRKPGVYALNAEGDAPLRAHCLVATRLASRSTMVATVLTSFAVLAGIYLGGH